MTTKIQKVHECVNFGYGISKIPEVLGLYFKKASEELN